MRVYRCERCNRVYESPIEVKGISCNGRDGIEHPSQAMEEVNDESL